jgi:hypothetical protein
VDSTPSGTHNAILYMYILPHSSLRSHPPLCALTGWARERGERVVRECGLRGCSVCMPINRANVVATPLFGLLFTAEDWAGVGAGDERVQNS